MELVKSCSTIVGLPKGGRSPSVHRMFTTTVPMAVVFSTTVPYTPPLLKTGEKSLALRTLTTTLAVSASALVPLNPPASSTRAVKTYCALVSKSRDPVRMIFPEDGSM